MIDTDKYEGHTEGRWDWLYNDEVPVHLLVVPQDVIGIGVHPENNVSEADMKLIADAPLLLAEVKRLQRYEREHKRLYIIANFSPKDFEEDDDIYHQWLESVSQGYMGSVYEYVMMKQEEMIQCLT